MKRLTLTLMAAATLTVSLAVSAHAGTRAPARDTPFPDVPREHWAFDAVESLRKRGIIVGYPPAAERPASFNAAPTKTAAQTKRTPRPRQR